MARNQIQGHKSAGLQPHVFARILARCGGAMLAIIMCCASCTKIENGQYGEATPVPTASAGSPAATKTQGYLKPAEEPGNISVDEYRKCMTEIADRMDGTIEDGWFFGEEPRLFKSFYHKISPPQKAEFAVAYHEFMSKFNQDLTNDYKSFVPYSKRADFAMDWWAAHDPHFSKSDLRMKILWAHESIQDAGELWWRAGEKLGKEPNNSVRLMAHDEEQRMVSRYTEKEGSPGSLSDQVWKRTH